MPLRLEPELQRYFEDSQSVHSAPLLRQLLESSGHLTDAATTSEQLRSAVSTAFAEDPVLAFMLRFDSVLAVNRGIITCLATVRRNIHHYELVYLQRFKQIAEPTVRHPKNREQVLLYLDPKALRCGQQVMVKIQARSAATEPLQLLRECSVLRASGIRDPPLFPRAYLFGCLGDSCWRVGSLDQTDRRRLITFRQHFLISQYSEESLQGFIDANRANLRCLHASGARRLGRDMLYRLKHLHSLGWTHGNLRPACFLFPGGSPDEILLSDFTAAAPIRRDCLTFDDAAAEVGEQLRDPVYASARFPGDAEFIGGEIFSDLESLVYILSAAMSLTQLPWEQERLASARDSEKLAFWQFIETAGAAASTEPSADQPEVEGENLTNSGNSTSVFNSCPDQEIRFHPVYKLATAVIRLFNDWTAANAADASPQQHSPDYTPLLVSLKD